MCTCQIQAIKIRIFAYTFELRNSVSAMKNILRLKFLFIILILGILLQGCSLFQKSSRKKAEKKMEQSDKQGNKEFENARQQHIKNQSKRTIKMMKKTKRHADKLNRVKKKNHRGKHC
jgi:predicted membrane protein